MMWSCAIVILLAVIMIAGRHHSRFLDQLEETYEMNDFAKKSRSGVSHSQAVRLARRRQRVARMVVHKT